MATRHSEKISFLRKWSALTGPAFPFLRARGGKVAAEPKTRLLILVPLMVMALLTILTGSVVHRRAWDWEQGVNRLTGQVSRLVILNNIQWSLRELRRDLRDNPTRADGDWREIQSQTRMLLRLPPAENEPPEKTLPVPLRLILSIERPTAAQVDALLNTNWIARNLEQMKQLKRLQSEATWITRAITLGMAGLGLVLAILTIFDLDRIFRGLADSRDLNIRLQEEERRRIAQELHDGVVQDLIDLKRGYAPEKVERVIHELRRICHNLKPQVLDDLGLADALERLADDLRRSGIPDVRFTLDEAGLASLPRQYELPLFRVVQELCANVRRHAGATRVRLTLVYNPAETPILSGSLIDDGCGFDPRKTQPDSMGLPGVRERLRQMGGRLDIESAPGQGSCFRFIAVPQKVDIAVSGINGPG